MLRKLMNGIVVVVGLCWELGVVIFEREDLDFVMVFEGYDDCILSFSELLFLNIWFC